MLLPYYQHKNDFRDKNTFTVQTKRREGSFSSAEDLFASARENALESFEELKLNEKCVSYECSYLFESEFTDVRFLFVESDFHILNLGYLPSSITKKVENGECLLISKSKQEEQRVGEISTSLLPKHYTTEYYDPSNYRDRISFKPSSSPNVFLLPLDECGSYRSKREKQTYSVYYTYHLNQDLQDNEFNRLSSLGGISAGRIIPIYQTFLHPAKDYYISYIPIKRITRVLIYICSVILLVSLLAGFLTDYLKRSDHKEETRRRKIFGMGKAEFILIQNTSVTFSLLLSAILCLILYVLFMVSFNHVSGFSFYFNPLLLLFFIGEVLFSFVFDSLFSALSYEKS